MTTIYRAVLETRNFTFEAYGLSAPQARETLKDGLTAHGKQYKIDPCWWFDEEGGIEVRDMGTGIAYRDGHRLT